MVPCCHYVLHRSPSLIIHPRHAECPPPPSLCHLPPRPRPHYVGSEGQGRWPNLSVTAPSPRGDTADTNYHTAGARPGNRMATTWSNQGTQQQGPEEAPKKRVTDSMCVCACVYGRSIFKLSKTKPVHASVAQVAIVPF